MTLKQDHVADPNIPFQFGVDVCAHAAEGWHLIVVLGWQAFRGGRRNVMVSPGLTHLGYLGDNALHPLKGEARILLESKRSVSEVREYLIDHDRRTHIKHSFACRPSLTRRTGTVDYPLDNWDCGTLFTLEY